MVMSPISQQRLKPRDEGTWVIFFLPSYVMYFLTRKSTGTPTRDLGFGREIAFGFGSALLGNFAQRNQGAHPPLALAQSCWSWDLHLHRRDGVARARSRPPPCYRRSATRWSARSRGCSGARRALLAMLGPAAYASPGAHGELVLYVFGRWQLRERRLLARLVLPRSLALSLARPERGAVVTAPAALVGRRAECAWHAVRG